MEKRDIENTSTKLKSKMPSNSEKALGGVFLHSFSKYLIVLLIAVLAVSSILYFISFSLREPNSLNTIGNNSPFLSLLPPTVYALSGTTPPLDTSTISLIAYYQFAGGWTLADTVPAFITYSDGGNYYDGLVRVWQGSDYSDVHVRVRADGWTLAWYNRTTDDPAGIVYWGHGTGSTGMPPTYSTVLSRAIELICNVAGVGFPGYDKIGMYDYSEPTATRLLIFGNSLTASSSTYYYTIPPKSPMTVIKLLVRSGVKTDSWAVANLFIDGELLYQKASFTGWFTNQISAVSKGVQHTVQQGAGGVIDPSGILHRAYSNVALIMWSS